MCGVGCTGHVQWCNGCAVLGAQEKSYSDVMDVCVGCTGHVRWCDGCVMLGAQDMYNGVMGVWCLVHRKCRTVV